MSSRKSRYFALVIAVWAFITYSFAASILGPSLSFIARDLHLNPIEMGTLASSIAIGFLTVFPAGILSDKIGRKKVMAGGLVLIGAGILTIGLSGTFVSMFLFAILLGVGGGLFEGSVNPFVSDLFPERRGLALNLLHLFWGAGAFAGPVVVGSILTRYGDWRLSFYSAAFIALPVTAAVTLLRLDSTIKIETGSVQGPFQGIRKRELLPVMAANLLPWGVEAAILGWVVHFLITERGFTIILATLTLGLFYLLVSTGRLLLGWLGDKYGYVQTVKTCAIAGGISLLSASVITIDPLIIPFFLVAGFFIGPLVPTIITIGCAKFPSASGTASGMILLGGDVGGIIIPWIVGLITQCSSIYFGFIFLAIILPLTSVSVARQKVSRI